MSRIPWPTAIVSLRNILPRMTNATAHRVPRSFAGPRAIYWSPACRSCSEFPLLPLGIKDLESAVLLLIDSQDQEKKESASMVELNLSFELTHEGRSVAMR